jgi:hypothetical protein
VAPHVGDSSTFHPDELARRDVELSTIMVRGRVLHGDNMVGADGHVYQPGAQRAAGQGTDPGQEVVADRLPPAMVAGDPASPGRCQIAFGVKHACTVSKSLSAKAA